MGNPLKPEQVNRIVTSNQPQVNNVLDTSFTTQLTTTTPDVQNILYFTSHASNTNVTNFLHGQGGQTIYILGNGHTTVVNGTLIKTNTAVNKNLAANKVYRFTYFSGVWYEDA